VQQSFEGQCCFEGTFFGQVGASQKMTLSKLNVQIDVPCVFWFVFAQIHLKDDVVLKGRFLAKSAQVKK
jgi:hypothetical protein